MKKIFFYKDLEKLYFLKKCYFNSDINRVKIDISSLQFQFVSLILYDIKDNFCYIEYHFNMRNRKINKKNLEKIYNFKNILKFTKEHDHLLNPGVK